MITESTFFLLIILVIFVFIVTLVLFLKMLALVSVFGWKQTKKLMQDPDWQFPTHGGVRKKIDKAIEELKKEKVDTKS